MRALLPAVLLAAACGGATPSPATPTPGPDAGPALSPALAPVAWLVGDWEADDGAVEHWVATAGALYGVAFTPAGFEVMIVDDADGGGPPDGTLRLYAMPGGAPATVFTRAGTDPRTLRFEAPGHDDPIAITYAADGDGVVATVGFRAGDQTIAMRPGAADEAPDAAAADVAFDADTFADGVDGWVRHFAADGAMLRPTGRIEGHAAIEAAMAPLLGRAKLRWAPAWSRISPDGTLAATVGRARILEGSAVTWRGSYVTIWRHDADGWRVVFDVGRDENPL